MDIAFRSTPWAQERAEQGSLDTAAKILFVSESNVCRSVLAEAITRRLLIDRGLAAEVTCDSKGTRCELSHAWRLKGCQACQSGLFARQPGPGCCQGAASHLHACMQDRGRRGTPEQYPGLGRDYNAGEGPEAVVLEVASAAGLTLPAGFSAQQLQPEVDIVHYDLVCVMDKFTAADVLREVIWGVHPSSPHGAHFV